MGRPRTRSGLGYQQKTRTTKVKPVTLIFKMTARLTVDAQLNPSVAGFVLFLSLLAESAVMRHGLAELKTK